VTSTMLERPGGSSLVDVVDTILDKGLVIDAYVRVSLIGIELLTIDARIVVASVDTYLRFAEAVNRLDLTQTGRGAGLPELMGDAKQGAAKKAVKGAAKGAVEAAKDKVTGAVDRARSGSDRAEQPDRAEEED